MNKTIFVIIIVILGLQIQSFASPKDTTSVKADSIKAWKFKSMIYTGLNQIGFVNWAAGGETSLSGKIGVDYTLNYNKRKFKFLTEGKLAYGLVGYIDKRVEKTNDKIDLLTSFSRSINSKWASTGVITFKSQFAPGYKYPDDSTIISEFMAPGYLTLSLGVNYKPHKTFQIFLSPVSGKFTFVLNQELANNGSFGVKKAVFDTAGNVIVSGKNLKGELGINIITSIKYDLMKNINVNSSLNLYNNYIDPNKPNRWNIDVDWDTRFIFTINKLFSTVFYFHMKYDNDSKTAKYEINDEGEKVKISEKPMLQLKESMGLSVTLKI